MDATTAGAMLIAVVVGLLALGAIGARTRSPGDRSTSSPEETKKEKGSDPAAGT